MTARVAPGVKLRLDVLRALMAERSWNWARLAEHAGMPLSSVVRLRDGDMQLTALTIGQLLHVFPRLRFEDLFDDGRDTGALADIDSRRQDPAA